MCTSRKRKLQEIRTTNVYIHFVTVIAVKSNIYPVKIVREIVISQSTYILLRKLAAAIQKLIKQT